jgi:hypothetical protein
MAVLAAAGLLWAQTSTESLYRAGQRYSELSVHAYQELAKQAPDSPCVFALQGEEQFKSGNTAQLCSLMAVHWIGCQTCVESIGPLPKLMPS